MSKKRKVSSFIQDLIHRGYKGHGEYGAIIRHEQERLVNVWENVRVQTSTESLAAIPPEIYHEICRLATVSQLADLDLHHTEVLIALHIVLTDGVTLESFQPVSDVVQVALGKNFWLSFLLVNTPI
jgi:hypothetical protein